MAEIINLAEARAAAQKRETFASIQAEFRKHMMTAPAGTLLERHARLAGAIEIVTRLWANLPDEPPDGGQEVGAAD